MMNADIARATWYVEDGVFRWKIARGRKMKAGDPAGSKFQKGRDNTEYLRVGFNGSFYYVHRLVWLMAHGEWPTLNIDHIDGNGLNNRIENLRDVSCSENHRNQRLRKSNTTGQCGVYWKKHRSKWLAAIFDGGKLRHLGYFEDFDDAVKARKEAEVKYGFHPNHGEVRKH